MCVLRMRPSLIVHLAAVLHDCTSDPLKGVVVVQNLEEKTVALVRINRLLAYNESAVTIVKHFSLLCYNNRSYSNAFFTSYEWSPAAISRRPG